METKERVLTMLYAQKGQSVSGEEIAASLGISRNSVWKTVNQLRKEGYEISSKTNDGYTLLGECELFNEYSIAKYARGKYQIELYDVLPSTNDTAKEYASKGAGEGTVIVARAQTKGKGRMGRKFFSESENGLYFSLILRPKISLDKCSFLTVMTAVSVLEAIKETCGRECQIKWVNDIYINDRKVCGILTEASLNMENASTDYAVIGIGINVSIDKDGFNDEIKDIAGAIFDTTDIKNEYKSKLLAKILDNIFLYYESFQVESFIEKYRKSSNLIGENVDVLRGNETIEGKVLDIDNEARLVIEDKAGKIHRFFSGEARVKRK